MKSSLNEIMVIGITGGIGSGKSTVSEYFRELGFPVISTDDFAKDIMNNNKSIIAKINNKFDNEILDENGKLNFKILSEKVFGNSQKNKDNLEKLNQIVHPPIIEKMISKIEELTEAGNILIFVESALIFETGLDNGFDYVISVISSENLRIERTQVRTGLSEQEIKWRMEEQFSSERIKQLSDFTIENNGTINDLKKSANFILNIVKSMPKKNFDIIE
jgi:dephospho-CoA kinase